jgi:hypothetical protein
MDSGRLIAIGTRQELLAAATAGAPVSASVSATAELAVAGDRRDRRGPDDPPGGVVNLESVFLQLTGKALRDR